jgi:hypothetical protein
MSGNDRVKRMVSMVGGATTVKPTNEFSDGETNESDETAGNPVRNGGHRQNAIITGTSDIGRRRRVRALESYQIIRTLNKNIDNSPLNLLTQVDIGPHRL